MGRRWIAVALLTPVFLLGITGCWSKEELNDRTFAMAMMVDLTDEGKTELSMLFYLPNRLSTGVSASNSLQKPFSLISRTGRNVAEALDNIQHELPRRITWGPMRIVIVGDRYASNGLRPLLDFLVRVSYIRLRTNLFYVSGEAKEVGALAPVFERFPSEVIREFSHMGILPEVILKDLLYSEWNGLSDAYLPELRMRQGPVITEKMEGQKWIVSGRAALIKDGTKAAMFSDRGTRGIQWLADDKPQMIVTVPSPSDGKLISVLVQDTERKVSAERKGDEMIVRIGLRASGRLLSTESELDVTKADSIKLIQRAVSEEIKDQMEEAVALARDNQADPFQWSEIAEYRFPSLWKEWQPQLRERLADSVDARITVRFELKDTGSEKDAVYSRKSDGSG
ncbi:Ger(x)C family spore germination protein [Cohnella faecalis]